MEESKRDQDDEDEEANNPTNQTPANGPTNTPENCPASSRKLVGKVVRPINQLSCEEKLINMDECKETKNYKVTNAIEKIVI